MSERFLADENFPRSIVLLLREQGHNVSFVAEVAPGAADPVVLGLTREDNRVLLSFDRDFGALVFARREPSPPGIVLFRVTQDPRERMLAFLRAFFASPPALQGYLTTVSDSHIRQAVLPP